jgi:hypothetical protein
LGLALLGVMACKDEPAPTAPTATTTAAATTPTATAAPQMPEALEVEALTTALNCTKAAHGPCSVLLEFSDCVAWSPVTSSGDGRWMGHGSVVKNGAFTDEVTLLRTRRVPTAEVGPGQLGAKIAIQALPDDRSLELEEAKRAITAYSRGDVPKPSNAGVGYLKELETWSEGFSTQAKNNQVYSANQGGAWLCAKQDQRLLLVRLASSREHKADGVYATLYPVTW